MTEKSLTKPFCSVIWDLGIPVTVKVQGESLGVIGVRSVVRKVAIAADARWILVIRGRHRKMVILMQASTHVHEMGHLEGYASRHLGNTENRISIHSYTPCSYPGSPRELPKIIQWLEIPTLSELNARGRLLWSTPLNATFNLPVQRPPSSSKKSPELSSKSTISLLQTLEIRRKERCSFKNSSWPLNTRQKHQS